MCGTESPNPDPERSGCSVAIVVDDTPYIVDFGPGLVRRAAALSPSYGGDLAAMETANLTRAFLTHLHSDHTVGYPDLILTPWVMGRNEPLEVWGASGQEILDEIAQVYDGKVIVGRDLQVIE